MLQRIVHAILPEPRRPRWVPFLGIALAVMGCGDAAPSTLKRPSDLAFTAAGDVLVADFHHHRVVRFGADGGYRGQVGRRGNRPGELYGIWGLDALPDGGFVVIDHSLTDIADETSYARWVKIFDAAGAQRVAFTAAPPGERDIGWPQGVVATPDGFIVGEAHHHALYFFSKEGRFIRELKEIEGGPPLDAPGRPTLYDGALWFTEYKAHRVRAITLDGVQLRSFGREGTAPGELLFPQDVAVHRDGWLVVADLGNYRLQRFDLDGQLLGVITPQPARPGIKVQLSAVGLGPDGNIYACDSKGGRVLVYTADGRLVRTLASWK